MKMTTNSMTVHDLPPTTGSYRLEVVAIKSHLLSILTGKKLFTTKGLPSDSHNERISRTSVDPRGERTGYLQTRGRWSPSEKSLAMRSLIGNSSRYPLRAPLVFPLVGLKPCKTRVKTPVGGFNFWHPCRHYPSPFLKISPHDFEFPLEISTRKAKTDD